MIRRATSFPLDLDVVRGCLDLDDSDGDRLFWRAVGSGLSGLDPSERRGGLATVTGHVAESVAALLLDDLGFQVVWQHAGPGPHGVDLLMLDPTLGNVVAIEVKGTLQSRRWPRLTNAELVQMSAAWLDKADNPGMAQWDLDSADVFGCVVMISFAQRAWRVAVTTDFRALRWLSDLDDLADTSHWETIAS